VPEALDLAHVGEDLALREWVVLMAADVESARTRTRNERARSVLRRSRSGEPGPTRGHRSRKSRTLTGSASTCDTVQPLCDRHANVANTRRCDAHPEVLEEAQQIRRSATRAERLETRGRSAAHGDLATAEACEHRTSFSPRCRGWKPSPLRSVAQHEIPCWSGMHRLPSRRASSL